MALTSAMEDYLEAVLMMQKRHGYVRCVDVAEHLGVKKPSVSRAVKELSKSGHLVKNADGTLSLTELGLQFAEQIYMNPLLFVGTATFVLLLIVVCVVLKAWHIANENPVKSIKSE